MLKSWTMSLNVNQIQHANNYECFPLTMTPLTCLQQEVLKLSTSSAKQALKTMTISDPFLFSLESRQAKINSVNKGKYRKVAKLLHIIAAKQQHSNQS